MDLLWPGDERAGDLCSDDAFLAAMVAFEEAWLDALAGAGIAPASVAKLDLLTLSPDDRSRIEAGNVREWSAQPAI